MVRPPPPLSDTLQAGQDLDIIACGRAGSKAETQSGHVMGVRWASRPDLGYPPSGYQVFRTVDGGQPEPIGNGEGGQFHLPPSQTWAEFSTDVEARRPSKGPYFEAADLVEENLGYLLPLIRLVDPRTPATEVLQLCEVAAATLGQSHADDAELKIKLWPSSDPPPLGDLLNHPQAADLLIVYYRNAAYGYLLSLAIRFEYAVILGLATDDYVEGGRNVVYEVNAHFTSVKGTASTGARPLSDPCAPPPPSYLKAEREPGSVAHPAFSRFTGWVPPAELLAEDGNKNLQTPESLIPRVPAAISALEWGKARPSNRLLDYGAVLYDLSRFDHGPKTAGKKRPSFEPADQDYKPILGGEFLMRPEQPPHALDAFGMPSPAMEGYYDYRIRGVDLLGAKSQTATDASIHHCDDIPPPSPGVRLLHEQAITFDDFDSVELIDLAVKWGSAHDFIGPDAAEFRVSARWVARRPIHVEVQSVESVKDSEHLGKVKLKILTEPSESLAGLRLILPDGEYPIVSHCSGAGAKMTIRRIAQRLPAPGQDGLIYAAGEELAAERIAKVPRRPMVPAWVTKVLDTEPLSLRLKRAGSKKLPKGEDVSIYVHILRTSFPAKYDRGNVWRIEPPSEDDPRRESWDNWLKLSDPAGLMDGSPTIVFPPHQFQVEVSPPAGFRAGLLMLDVSAADGTAYVSSPKISSDDIALSNLKGNESSPTTASLSYRVLSPPNAPKTLPFDPKRIIWAEAAAKYSEDAEYLLTWPTNGAAHYEVWRVLEGALIGGSPRLPDTTIRALAAEQEDNFSLRSLKVFGGRYRDKIPGRTPTRALYRVRGVSEAGVPGAWSELIGPIHVPDVRQPAAPNLVRVFAPKPSPKNPNANARQLILEWTVAGSREDVRFDIEAFETETDLWRVVGLKPRGALPEPGPARVFRHVISGMVPGRKVTFRVRAVREARDPIDPFGQRRHEIRGAPSVSRTGQPTGVLASPVSVSGVPIANGDPRTIVLSWINADPYRSIEILRQGPGEFRLRRIAGINGSLESFVDNGVSPGLWQYQIRALGYSRLALSEVVEVRVP